MSIRQEKIAAVIREKAAEYITTIATNVSLVTVTRTDISPDLQQATVYITVLPEDQEEHSLSFVRRHKNEMRAHLAKAHFRRIPQLSIELDHGERNRRHIEDISKGIDNSD